MHVSREWRIPGGGGGGRGGGGEGLNKSFVRGGFVPRSSPLSFYIASLTGYQYNIPCIDKWYSFHIPCLELYIPFNCCKGAVFKI